MSHKIFASMNIAIVGNGTASRLFTENLSDAGHNIFAAYLDKEDEIMDRIFCDDNITPCSIEDAAGNADIIIIATDPARVREVAYRIDDVRGKVVIDASNIVPQSATANLNTLNAIRSITGSQHVVKCFNCKEYESMVHMFYKDEPIDMFIAGDSKKAKEVMKLLTRDLGYMDCYDFGNAETVSLLEDMARCMISFAAKGETIDLRLMKG